MVVHARHPERDHALCGRACSSRSRVAWIVLECTCKACLRMLKRRPALVGAINAARQTLLDLDREELPAQPSEPSPQVDRDAEPVAIVRGCNNSKLFDRDLAAQRRDRLAKCHARAEADAS